jgi:hypothetical protein
MKCYQPIEVPNWKIISEKVYNFVIDTDIIKNQFSWNTINPKMLFKSVEELESSFDHLNLKIKTTAIIYRKPFYQGGIHIDSGIGIRALIPIRNYEGSYTKFFDVDNDKIKISYGKEGDKFYQIPNSAVKKEIASIESKIPFVFNPQIPHGVYTNLHCNLPRLTLTIGFDKSPEELLK